MGIQVGVSEMFALLPHDHTSVGEGGKLNKYSDVFNNLDLIANILSDHSKVLHDALNIDADSVDGEHSGEIVTIGRVEDTFPSWNPAVHSKAVHDALSLAFSSLDLTGHNKAIHDALGIEAAAHAAEHKAAGGDPIKIDELAVPDDNTLLNVLTTKHGLCPKLPNDAAKFLNGVGNWVAAGGGLSKKVLYFTRDMTAGSGAVDYNGAGFPPSLVIGIGGIEGSSNHVINIAFSDGSLDTLLLTWGDNDTACEVSNTNFFVPRLTTANHQTAVVNTFLADGVRLSWTKLGTPTGTFKFALLFLK